MRRAVRLPARHQRIAGKGAARMRRSRRHQ
jgi:hypothetical protein